MNVDITKLDKAQLAALKAQLDQLSKQKRDSRKLWADTVKQMLMDKDEAGAFRNTTADIWSLLFRDGLESLDPTTTTDQKQRDSVLKKIQAFKQKLEKETDETGNLVHAEGTFGYKATATALQPRQYKPENVVAWFANPENVNALTAEDVGHIITSLKGQFGDIVKTLAKK
jgi:hypothetical protein